MVLSDCLCWDHSYQPPQLNPTTWERHPQCGRPRTNHILLSGSIYPMVQKPHQPSKPPKTLAWGPPSVLPPLPCLEYPPPPPRIQDPSLSNSTQAWQGAGAWASSDYPVPRISPQPAQAPALHLRPLGFWAQTQTHDFPHLTVTSSQIRSRECQDQALSFVNDLACLEQSVQIPRFAMPETISEWLPFDASQPKRRRAELVCVVCHGKKVKCDLQVCLRGAQYSRITLTILRLEPLKATKAARTVMSGRRNAIFALRSVQNGDVLYDRAIQVVFRHHQRHRLLAMKQPYHKQTQLLMPFMFYPQASMISFRRLRLPALATQYQSSIDMPHPLIRLLRLCDLKKFTSHHRHPRGRRAVMHAQKVLLRVTLEI